MQTEINKPTKTTVFSRPYLVQLRSCYSVASVVVCLSSCVRNVLWLNSAS